MSDTAGRPDGRKSTLDYWDENWRRASDTGISGRGGLRTGYVWQRIDKALERCFGAGHHDGESLIELGAGASQWLPYLHARFGYRVAGLDYSAIGCDRARENLRAAGIDGAIHHADMFAMPSQLLGAFDVACSFGLVEHFTDTAKAVSACASCVKPGGLIVTMIPNMRGLNGALYRLLDRKVFETHVPLSLDDLCKAHRDAGLDVAFGEYLIGLPGIIDGDRREPNPARRLIRSLAHGTSKAYWRLEARGLGVRENPITSPYMICCARRPLG